MITLHFTLHILQFLFDGIFRLYFLIAYILHLLCYIIHKHCAYVLYIWHEYENAKLIREPTIYRNQSRILCWPKNFLLIYFCSILMQIRFRIQFITLMRIGMGSRSWFLFDADPDPDFYLMLMRIQYQNDADLYRYGSVSKSTTLSLGTLKIMPRNLNEIIR